MQYMNVTILVINVDNNKIVTRNTFLLSSSGF